ncbi:MAG: peptide-methionine (S)-S-oxide reductase MsrA [Bdellovibrionales bacterium]
MKESLVVAAGCFWGVEELIRKVDGVLDTEVGYTGGKTENPTYETVKTGSTGHAESIRITFDSAKISRADLLQLFFKLHDPTTRNRQGNDVGSQYRSAIFVSNAEEESVARASIEEALRSGRWSRPVVTTIEPLKTFYSAEAYHQNYLQKNPGGYTCHFWRE